MRPITPLPLVSTRWPSLKSSTKVTATSVPSPPSRSAGRRRACDRHRDRARIAHEALHVGIDHDVARAERPREVQALERGYPAEGDIGLARGERTRAEVDDGGVIGLALRLV